MLRRDWNALRTRDRVLVHHTVDGDQRLCAGVVIGVQVAGSGNEVEVRIDTERGQETISPSRLAVHRDPIDLDGHCWRCSAGG